MKKIILTLLMISSLFLFGCSFLGYEITKKTDTKEPTDTTDNNQNTQTNTPQEGKLILNGEISLYYDSNCKEQPCDPNTLKDIVENQIGISGAKINYVDLQKDSESMKMITTDGIKTTPVLKINKEQFDVFSKNRSEIVPYFQEKGNNYYLPFFSWEVGKENNCADGADNDGDGLIDDKDTDDCKLSVILYDNRCSADDDMLCDVEGLKQQLATSIFPLGYIFNAIDVSTQEGKELLSKYSNAGIDKLPIVTTSYIEPSLLENFKSQGGVKEINVDDQKYLISWFAGNWDVNLANECFKQDGTIDCKNSICSEYKQCIPEEKASLDLYIMGYCPFGELAAEALTPIMQHFKDDKINLGINYIADHIGDGYTLKDFRSLHGDPETEENIRQLCITKNYGTDKLVDYFIVRYKSKDNYGKVTDDPKVAVEAIGGDYNKIKECTENGEGGKLLAENVKIAKGLGVSGSPTWYINKKYKTGGYEPASIISQFCKYNNDLQGCKTEFQGATSSSDNSSQPQCGN